MFAQEDKNNPLAAFGQRPSPPAGSKISEIYIKNDDHNGYFDKIKSRYVWMPFHDINMVGKLVLQPLTTDYIERCRIVWLQPVAYKALDNSPEAMDQQGEQELPLRTFVMTPYGQGAYLHANYAEKGIQVFDHLKGEAPELVAYIEQVVLPEVPNDLLSLGKYLTTTSPKNIIEAGFDAKTEKLANLTLACMIEGTNLAVKYARELIETTEGEILTRRNKGVGKASLDMNDRLAYTLLKKAIPAEATLDSSSGNNQTTELLAKLVELIDSRNGVKPSPVPVQENVEAQETIKDLRKELDDMKDLFKQAMERLQPAPSGAPSFESNEETNLKPEQIETATEDLRRQLKTGNNPQGNKLRK